MLKLHRSSVLWNIASSSSSWHIHYHILFPMYNYKFSHVRLLNREKLSYVFFFRFNYISWHAYLSGLIVFPAIKRFNDWIVFATPVDVSLSDLCHILFLPYVKDVIIGNYCRFTPMLQCHAHKRHSNVNSFNSTKAMRMSKAHTSFNQYEKKVFLKRFSRESR